METVAGPPAKLALRKWLGMRGSRWSLTSLLPSYLSHSRR